MLTCQSQSQLSPEPILAAAATYSGSLTDLDRSLVLSSAEFARGRTTLASRMKQLGLARGDRVVMAISNGPLFPATLLAVLDGGGSPILVHADTPPAELRRIALRYGARFLLADCHNPTCLEPVSAQATLLAGTGWIRLAWAWVDETDPEFQGDYPSLPSVPLHPTSGTTGQPKLAARPGPCAVAEAIHYVETIGIDANDVILNLAPMCHAYAYGLCVMVSLLTGASLVTMRRFHPSLAQQALQECGITILPAVPVMLDMMLFGAGNRLYNPARRVFTAGAPLPMKTAARFRKACGSLVRPLYGSTETGVIAIVGPDHQGDAGDCVGPPCHGVSVEVRPCDAESPSHELGRVWVRSPSMMAGYLCPGRLDPSPIIDGWFTPGDLGILDASGNVHLKGRETDVINVFGMKVIPSEVEEIIKMLPEVSEVMVYAGRSSGSQFVKATIVVSSPIEDSAIRAHCEKHLVYYKRPEKIAFLEALPRNAAGKIVRERLP